MKTLIFTFSIFFSVSAHNQWLSDLEEFVIPADSALFGSEQVTDGDTVYTDGPIFYETNWNAAWSSFAGFAMSNVIDNTTPGYANQFSAITGEGVFGSNNYAICYASAFEDHRIFFNPWGMSAGYVDGIHITNTTYAYYSMLDGDGFAKKFGEDTSATGTFDGTNGEDWFLLTIYALDGDSSYTGDSVNFYLADYRFAADSLDYIISDWTSVNLSVLGPISGLDFVLTSSDTSGGFGMNTPAYFAIDNLGIGWEGIDEPNADRLQIYPNPAARSFSIEHEIDTEIKILDPLGRVVHSEFCERGVTVINSENYTAGIYIVIAKSDGRTNSKRIIKL